MKIDKIESTEKAIESDTIVSPFLSKEHYAELLSSGFNHQDIIDTGCFTVTSKSRGRKLTGYNLAGLVIPYFDPTGKPYTTANGSPFYRIKPDWSLSPNPDECPKYLSPKREGNRPYFAPTYKQWAKVMRFNKVPVHLVEGEKTAAALGASGYAAIGLPGVNGFKDRTDRGEELEFDAPYKQEDNEGLEDNPEQLENSRVLPELEYIGGEYFWKHRKVYISFDSDIAQKWQVKNALKNLAIWLKEKGAEVYIVLLPSELNGDKNGVDDLIFRHGIEAFEKALKAAEPAFNYNKKKPVFNMPTDPGLFQKASLLWGVLKEHWRYRPGIGWHQWIGDRWDLTDDGAGTYIDEDIYQFLSANEWKAQGNGSMANLLRHMKAKLMVRQWNPKNKIAFKNGVLDLDSGSFATGHRREDFMTVALPYPYNPDAKCPTWERIISEALGGKMNAVELVQALFRWSVLPKADRKLDLEIGWDLYGRAGTGKGTVLETLKNLVGHENCGSFTSKTLSNPNILAGLIDKRVSISADDDGHMEDFGTYGKIMSNESVCIKLLYKNVFPTTLNTFMVRAYNNFITTPSGAKGLDRRIIAMTFDRQPEKIDTDLQSKIDNELSGIFNWAWNISNAEMKRRILWAGEVEAVQEASTQMFYANNHAFIFLQETYPDGNDRVRSRDLYHQYTNWYQGEPSNRLGHRKFCDAIKNYGCIQLNKTQGYSPFEIPPMKDISIIHEFGILRGKTKSDKKEVEAETTEKVEEGELRGKTKSDDSALFPSNISDGERDVEASGEKENKGNNFGSNTSALFNLENQHATDSETPNKSITVDPPQLELPKTIPTPSPNPKGTITHKRYLMGEIGNVIISFDKQRLAKEWSDYIALVFGYYGTIEKNEPKSGRYNWRLVFPKFDKEALARLERKDLSQPPQQR